MITKQQFINFVMNQVCEDFCIQIDQLDESFDYDYFIELGFVRITNRSTMVAPYRVSRIRIDFTPYGIRVSAYINDSYVNYFGPCMASYDLQNDTVQTIWKLDETQLDIDQFLEQTSIIKYHSSSEF